MTSGLLGRTLPAPQLFQAKIKCHSVPRVREGGYCNLGLLGKGLFPRSLTSPRGTALMESRSTTTGATHKGFREKPLPGASLSRLTNPFRDGLLFYLVSNVPQYKCARAGRAPLRPVCQDRGQVPKPPPRAPSTLPS